MIHPSILLPAAALLLLTMTPSCTPRPSSVPDDSPAGPQPDRAWTYRTIDGKALALHGFLPDRWRADDRRPGIVFFFGGGFNGGTPAQFHPQASYLASRGMVALCAEYRVKSRDGVTPDRCVADARAAMAWMRSHADDLGIDPHRIVAAGGSAGGHLAAATATLDAFDPDDLDPSISPEPNALVLFNPVLDSGPGGFAHDAVKPYWRDFSPLHNIEPGMPPALFMLGDKDHLIPVTTAERFEQRMKEVGSRCVVKIYQGAGHGFFNYRDGHNPYYYQTMREVDRFLGSLGYLKGEPTLTEPAQ